MQQIHVLRSASGIGTGVIAGVAVGCAVLVVGLAGTVAGALFSYPNLPHLEGHVVLPLLVCTGEVGWTLHSSEDHLQGAPHRFGCPTTETDALPKGEGCLWLERGFNVWC